MFLDLKANNTYFEGKKQVGKHVEKSPEPKNNNFTILTQFQIEISTSL